MWSQGKEEIVTLYSSISPEYNVVQNNRHMVIYLCYILEYIVTLIREDYDVIKSDWFTTLSCEVISLKHIALRITVNYVIKRQSHHHRSWLSSSVLVNQIHFLDVYFYCYILLFLAEQRVMCQCSVGALLMYTLHEVISPVLFMSKGVFTQSWAR